MFLRNDIKLYIFMCYTRNTAVLLPGQIYIFILYMYIDRWHWTSFKSNKITALKNPFQLYLWELFQNFRMLFRQIWNYTRKYNFTISHILVSQYIMQLFFNIIRQNLSILAFHNYRFRILFISNYYPVYIMLW